MVQLNLRRCLRNMACVNLYRGNVCVVSHLSDNYHRYRSALVPVREMYSHGRLKACIFYQLFDWALPIFKC